MKKKISASAVCGAAAVRKQRGICFCIVCALFGVIPGTAAAAFCQKISDCQMTFVPRAPQVCAETESMKAAALTQQGFFSDFFTGDKFFKLHAAADSLAVSSGVLFNAALFLFKPEGQQYTGSKLNIDGVNRFDRWAARRYSHAGDIAGTVAQVVSVLTPAVFFSMPRNEWGSLGVMYLESVLFAYGFKETGKALVSRYRPYMYFDGFSGADNFNDGDYKKSWFSGHTTMAFNGAVFTSYVFSVRYPDSKLRIPVIAGSLSLAVGTAALRIISGNHFLSDVLTGAVIGSMTGFLVPFVHHLYAKRVSSAVEFSLLPNGFVFRCHR